MCTLSWMSGRGFRRILVNRDENRERPPESPPVLHAPEGMPRFVAPVDPESGGTWVAANEYGLACAVLNHYATEADAEPPRAASAPRRSRGELPISLMGFRRAGEAEEWIRSAPDLADFRPFILALFGERETGFLAQWDGRDLGVRDLEGESPPVSTSSRRPREVIAERERLFRAMTGPRPGLDELLAFHGHHDPACPETGPAMIRPDASTRSLCVVRIDATDIAMRHQPFDAEAAVFLAPSEIKLPRRIVS
jgi:hypothetical protein